MKGKDYSSPKGGNCQPAPLMLALGTCFLTGHLAHLQLAQRASSYPAPAIQPAVHSGWL